MKRFMLVSLMSCVLVGQTSCGLQEICGLQEMKKQWNETLVGQGAITGFGVPALVCGVIHACKKGSWVSNVVSAALEGKNVQEVVKANPTIGQLHWGWTAAPLAAGVIGGCLLTAYNYGRQHEANKNSSEDARGDNSAKYWGAFTLGSGLAALIAYASSK